MSRPPASADSAGVNLPKGLFKKPLKLSLRIPGSGRAGRRICLLCGRKFQCHLAWQEKVISNHTVSQSHRALLGRKPGAKAEALCGELPGAEPTTRARAQTLRKAGSPGQPGGGQARGAQARGQVRPEYSQGASEMRTQLSGRQTSTKESLGPEVSGTFIHC